MGQRLVLLPSLHHPFPFFTSKVPWDLRSNNLRPQAGVALAPGLALAAAEPPGLLSQATPGASSRITPPPASLVVQELPARHLGASLFCAYDS